ncbi:nuclear transport factor 2 family protein [Parafrankia elaeagni]|uniref:nuclear transport factor 2 family protein n=1 Tax=Parafrankia elaeagni TaxID=222534 RepID=UPI00036DFD5C|nr:nuclear transport factor 2 family protein [Parafrankia elaeagni]
MTKGELSLEERVLLLEDRAEILQSLYDYGELLDTRDLDAWARLWAEDGVFEMSTGRTANGRAAIRDMLAAVMERSATPVIHMEMNPRITLEGDTARSTMLYGVARTQDDGLTRVIWLGHHHSRHVRTPDGWKISYRRNTVDLPETGHP